MKKNSTERYFCLIFGIICVLIGVVIIVTVFAFSSKIKTNWVGGMLIGVLSMAAILVGAFLIGYGRKKRWKLEIFDTFLKKFYSLRGEYPTEKEAIQSAKKIIKLIESKEKFEDKIYVVKPNGTRCQVVVEE